MIAAWIVFPLVMLVVCTGCGLLLDTIAGWRLPGTILALCGLAVAVVALSLSTAWVGTAEASTPMLALLAAAGFVVGRHRLRELRPERWAAALSMVVFALCAAPVVLSDNATFLGYYILNDSSFHLGLANLLVGHGPRMTDLPQDGYTAVVGSYVATKYPTGADIFLGGLSKLVGQNVAWNFQPYLAVVVTLGAVGLYELLGRVVTSRPLRGACALVAGVNGFLYSLYAVASIKEIVMTTLLTMLAWVVVESVDHLRPRGLIPLIVITASTLDVLGITAVPWIGVPLVAFAVVGAWRLAPRIRRLRTRRVRPTLEMPISRLAPLVTVGGLGLVALAAPIIQKAATFFNVSSAVLSSSSTTGPSALGYLIEPLNRFQMLGIWPDYDFRFPLEAHQDTTFILIGIELLSAAMGTLWLIRKRGWGPLTLCAGSGTSTIYLLDRATPYAASKVFLIASVAVVLTVTTGAAALYDARRRVEAWLLIALLMGGVLWTDALVYRYSSVAPSGRLHELNTIDERFNGQGPALYPYGADSLTNYMLHDLDPSTADTPGVTPRPGLVVDSFVRYQLRWDTDNISQPFLQGFKLLVMDGSPAFSRPPADFRLAYHGRYYNVWRRTSTPKVIQHVGFGTYPYSSAIPSCKVLTSTAKTAIRDHAQLAYVLGTPTATLIPAHLKDLPAGWVPIGEDPDELIPRGGPAESVTGSITAPRAGSYQVWFDGSFGQKFTVSVDGRQVGSISHQLGPAMQATQIATINLRAGRHTVTVTRPQANALLPGQDDANPNNRSVGPVMFVSNHRNYAVSTINPNQAKTLCGQSLDWLEIVR